MVTLIKLQDKFLVKLPKDSVRKMMDINRFFFLLQEFRIQLLNFGQDI